MAKATTAWVTRWENDATVDLLDRDGAVVASVEHADVGGVRTAELVCSTLDTLRLRVEAVRVVEDSVQGPWVAWCATLAMAAASWSFGTSVR